MSAETLTLRDRLGYLRVKELRQMGQRPSSDTTTGKEQAGPSDDAAANPSSKDALAGDLLMRREVKGSQTRRVHLAEPCAAEGGALRERREVVEFIVEPVLLVHGEAWWLKAENLQPWGGLRRAPEATVSLRDAQAALWGA